MAVLGLGQISSEPWLKSGSRYHTFSRLFSLILLILAGNEEKHKILDEFKFRPDPTTDYGVSRP